MSDPGAPPALADRLRDEPERAAELQRLATAGLLAAGVVHEVRNAMTGILGFAQVGLRRADPGSETHDLLEMIETETQRCLGVLVGFLEFVRHGAFRAQPVAVDELVRDVARLSAHRLSLAKVQLDVDVAAGLPPVSGDPGLLAQVLLNLVLNAMQALQPGGGRVGLTARREGAAVRIAVSDGGPGISEELLARIFDPFATTKPQGTGLGLFVSREIALRHGGTLTVDSAPGRGSTFHVLLPALEETG